MWSQKEKPKTYEDFYFHNEIIKTLKNLKQNPTNLIFYGKKGIGKRTVANIFSNQVLKNPDKNKTYVDLANINQRIIFKSKSNWTYNDNKIAKRDNLFSIKDVCFSKPIDDNIKIIILDNVSNLDVSTQQSLRVTMERSYARFILLSQSFSQIIEPIKSRCLSLKFSTPNTEEYLEVLTKLLNRKNIKYEKKALIYAITKKKKDLFAILNLLEYIYIKNKEITFTDIQKQILHENKNIYENLKQLKPNQLRKELKKQIFLGERSKDILKQLCYDLELSEDKNKIKKISQISDSEKNIYLGNEEFYELENIVFNSIF